jgi:predicted ATPase
MDHGDDTGAQLLSVTHTHPKWADQTRFPFSVPSIRSLQTLDLDASVVCFVGENGSGKSTLLESIAIAASLPSAGAAGRAKDDPTLAEQQFLANALKLVWRSRNNRGFFLRAEDFFGFQHLLKRERAEFVETLARMEVEYEGHSERAKVLAMGPLKNSLTEMEQRYGADPDAKSHGEAFLNFFQQRLVPRGLYLMDEPEAALSPQRQLSLLAMMFDLVAEGAQFIIATHSPLLLAYPGARIYSFDAAPVEEVPWDQTDHVRLTREFLAAPERYLRNLRG